MYRGTKKNQKKEKNNTIISSVLFPKAWKNVFIFESQILGTEKTFVSSSWMSQRPYQHHSNVPFLNLISGHISSYTSWHAFLYFLIWALFSPWKILLCFPYLPILLFAFVYGYKKDVYGYFSQLRLYSSQRQIQWLYLCVNIIFLSLVLRTYTSIIKIYWRHGYLSPDSCNNIP